MNSAPVLEGRASKSSMEASSQMAGSGLRRPYIHISGGELHMCASRPTRDASASRCAAMFEWLGHERGAHQRWSARSGAALDRDVQVVRHRALRLQSRLAPDDDADACALTRSEAGRRSNGPSVARGVGKRWGQAALTCRSIDKAFGGRSTKTHFYSSESPHGGEPNVFGAKNALRARLHTQERSQCRRRRWRRRWRCWG